MLVAVGGHSRNIGKTAVAAGLIATIPEVRWQAIKITQFGHGHCSEHGGICDCSPVDVTHPFALDPQNEPDATDTGRFLAAGAARSWWLRTRQGELGHALPRLKELLSEAGPTIVESNSILQFFRPDVYVVVLDYSVPDMKDSTRRYFDRADAFAIVENAVTVPPWPGVPARWLEKPRFLVRSPEFRNAQLTEFVRSRVTIV